MLLKRLGLSVLVLAVVLSWGGTAVAGGCWGGGVTISTGYGWGGWGGGWGGWRGCGWGPRWYGGGWCGPSYYGPYYGGWYAPVVVTTPVVVEYRPRVITLVPDYGDGAVYQPAYRQVPVYSAPAPAPSRKTSQPQSQPSRPVERLSSKEDVMLVRRAQPVDTRVATARRATAVAPASGSGGVQTVYNEDGRRIRLVADWGATEAAPAPAPRPSAQPKSQVARRSASPGSPSVVIARN